jgi:hypothetical protein
VRQSQSGFGVPLPNDFSGFSVNRLPSAFLIAETVRSPSVTLRSLIREYWLHALILSIAVWVFWDYPWIWRH